MKKNGTGVTEHLERALMGRIRARLGLDIPSAELDLIETGLIDSLTFVELLLVVEEEFGTSIDVAELELDDFRSIARMARFLAARNAAAGAG
jgi:acyl carrier protein